ncbi:hypothetical protein [Polymorphobacter fuscus]|uniref:Uncharacterized protein n=1 Tax=Sandarakinorhabdus fusca TaxID=1439888 RepID=A0A7C9KJ52_9SPHN|nr:hypothetical protein [Polymorphobacter fuscus]KAB7646567.1 hypothetical protein F9290_11185 [Polymorphobacter fuscus]MQT17819.1 hypothetical protein [Polymorphobacter fuscus]NJC09632.1 hypothetical protein [Polymorphobacter fuscus]
MNASAGPEIAGTSARKRRWLIWGPVLLLCLLSGGWLGLKYSSLGKRADVGAGYIAHVVCSCRYVGNRDMASCKTDFEPGTEIVEVAEDAAARRITARVPWVSKRTAQFDPEYGCTLDTP